MTTAKQNTMFKLEKNDDGVAVLRFNVPDQAQNTLSTTFGEQLAEMMASVENDTEVTAVVLISDKPGSFLAGADIDELDQVKTAEEAAAMADGAKEGFDRLENLHVPVIAAIEGSCLGGGLELALACDMRIAAETDKTALGLPEVMLGLLPAGGGTQRLPRLIGLTSALDLLLTGKQIRPKKAKKLGVIDDYVNPEALEGTAIKRAATAMKARRDGPAALVHHVRERVSEGTDGAQHVALEDNPAGRKVVFDQARKKVNGQTRGNYPAPFKILDAVAAGYQHFGKSGPEVESRGFGELVVSPESHALRSVFHATEALKKETFVAKNVKPRTVNQVGVLGAGLMGAGIATVSVEKAGKRVRLKDRDTDAAATGVEHIRSFYDKRVSRGALSRHEADRRMRRVMPTTDYSGFGACDVVIEAVFEDLELKQKMLADVEEHGHKDTIFATNTSSIPIADIAATAKRPENVIGMHYFSPVEKMPLLEIIATPQTSKKTIATCVELGKAQGKTVIVVGDGPGFYTTRILSPYLNEVARLVSEGVGVREMDEALLDVGFPVGPMSLLDEVGVDVGAKVGPMLEEAFGERMAAPSTSRAMIDAGFLGRKSGKGFYDYTQPKKKGKRPVNEELFELIPREGSRRVDAGEIAERCLLLFANEAAHCIGEGLVKQPMYADIGAIFGLGFPPFTGGPLRYIDSYGVQAFVERLDALVEQHGARFEPAPVLRKMCNATSESGRRFYAE